VFSNSEEIYTIEIDKTNSDGQLDEVSELNLEDMEGRKVKGLGLVVFAGRLWIFNKQVLWYSVQENIYDFKTSDAEIKTSSGFIEFVKNISNDLSFPTKLSEFSLKSEDLIGLADQAVAMNMMNYLPRSCSNEELYNILQSAF
jgi:hypothetical protein